MMNKTLVNYVLFHKVKAIINVVTIKYLLLHVICCITLPNLLDDTRKYELYEKKIIIILPFFKIISYTRDNTKLITFSVNSCSRVLTYVIVKIIQIDNQNSYTTMK